MDCARFGKAQRLNHVRDYQSVFEQAAFRISARSFLCLARFNTVGGARIGIVVSKKTCRLATGRNRIKRLVRESFRSNQTCLQGLDIVILARSGIAGLNNRQLSEQLRTLWIRLNTQAQAGDEALRR